jgi:hypothetical protein
MLRGSEIISANGTPQSLDPSDKKRKTVSQTYGDPMDFVHCRLGIHDAHYPYALLDY